MHSSETINTVYTDVALDDHDPATAYADFVKAVEGYPRGLCTYTALREAYRLVTALMTEDELSAFWRAAKAAGKAGQVEHKLYPLYLYGKIRDAEYRRTPQAKAKRAELDARRAADPRRRAKVREIQARYRARRSSTTTREEAAQ